MLEPLTLPFFQRALWEILLLAIVSGLLGTWIVLRGLAFFAHAVGTATFPGLVLADGLGFAPFLGALGAALAVAWLVAMLAERRATSADSVTALALAAALAVGIILASDVFAAQASVERLLFGSLLAIGWSDVALAAVVALVALVAALLGGPRWLAAGFDEVGDAARPRRGAGLALVLLTALAAVAALSAVGALLATAIVVVPAATTRLVTNRVASWQIATVLLAAAQGAIGMWVAFQVNVPPGAAIAVLAGAVFLLVAVVRRIAASRSRASMALAALGGVAALAFGGCAGGNGSTARSGQLEVVATTTIAGDLAGEVGGREVAVTTLLRPGSDPHEYEPRAGDVRKLAGADVVVASGLGLDAWVDELIGASGSEARVVRLGDHVPTRLEAAGGRGGEVHHGEGDVDPHWWGDPHNVLAAVGEIERAYAAADPHAAGSVAKNAAAYRRRLRVLDRRIASCIARVPWAQRRIVTDHDAFAYFATRYGIELVGAVIPSTTTRAETSAGDLAELERTIRREKVRAIFPEVGVSPRLAEQLARQTGASTAYTLYSDALGGPGSGADTYIGAQRANAAALVAGMSGGAKRCETGA